MAIRSLSLVRGSDISLEECKDLHKNITQISEIRAKSTKFDIKIMFIGSAGSGKSSLINSFANYSYSKDISNFFLISDNEGPSWMPNIFVNSRGRERLASPKAKINNKERVTTSILYYRFKLNNLNLLLIDTPGISESNSGPSIEDIEFFDNTKRVIKALEIKTIVFLQKATEQALCKSVKSYVENLNLFFLTEKIEIKILLALTFYPGSISFNIDELPFKISGKIKLDNGVFNYKDPGKLLKARNLWIKIDKVLFSLVQHFVAGVELESAEDPNKSEDPNSQKILKLEPTGTENKEIPNSSEKKNDRDNVGMGRTGISSENKEEEKSSGKNDVKPISRKKDADCYEKKAIVPSVEKKEESKEFIYRSCLENVQRNKKTEFKDQNGKIPTFNMRIKHR